MRDIKYSETAVVICTYKNRYDCLLKHVNSWTNDFPVFIVCRRDDFTKSGYDAYQWNDKVNVILLDNVHNIMETREAAKNEIIKLGYRAMIMIDDDINGDIAKKILPETKRTTSDSYSSVSFPFLDLLKDLVDYANEYDASFNSTIMPMNIGFGTPGKVGVNASLNYGCLVFINLEDLQKHNISYETEIELHEDFDIVFQLLRAGCNCITLLDRCFSMKGYDPNTSVVGDESFLKVGTYLKWKNYYPIDAVYRKRNDCHVITGRKNLKKLFNNKEEYFEDTEYNKQLYDICKEQFYGERNIDKIIEFIVNNKKKK